VYWESLRNVEWLKIQLTANSLIIISTQAHNYASQFLQRYHNPIPENFENSVSNEIKNRRNVQKWREWKMGIEV
jgi:hypothetical protein